MATYYSDLDLKFNQHPLTKDIMLLEDEDSIKNSIKNIILTNKKERILNLDFGGNIRDYLFEELDFLLIESLKEDIITLIAQYEPRVENVKISVTNYENIISLNIVYTMKKIAEVYNFDLKIKKVR